MNTISAIAGNCSRSGGRAVMLARQLFSLNDHFNFDDDSICQYNQPQPIILSSGEDRLSKEKLTVYPNPSNGNFIIEVKNGVFIEGAELLIYDLKGRKVFSKFIEKECKKIEINKSNFGLEGIFICKLISNNDLLYSPKIILNK